MAINFREGVWGLEHLRIALCRKLFKTPSDAYIKRYENKGASIELCHDLAGNAIACDRCGYLLVRARYQSGWTMEMCSAHPLVALDNPVYVDWLATLTQRPVSAVEKDIPLEPILHE